MGSTALALSSEHPNPSRPLWRTVQSLVLEGLCSPHTRRAYEQALEEFLIWGCGDTSLAFTKATVQKYRGELRTKGLAPASINLRISAIRKLAAEAADNGLLAPELAAGIARVQGAKRVGVRLGHWLTAPSATGK